MAQEVVVRETLTSEMIKAGEELVRRLDSTGFKATAILWLFLDEPNKWRLKIATPEVGEIGPLQVYRRLQTILSDMPEDTPRVSLVDISAVEDDDPLVSLLGVAINTGDGIAGIRFSGNAINGHYIEDAYIYKVT